MPDVVEQLAAYGAAVEAAVPPARFEPRRSRRPLLLAAAAVLVVGCVAAAVLVLNTDDRRGPTVDTVPHDPEVEGWRTLDPGPLPPREGSALVWTGDELVVWGGPRLQDNDAGYADGAAYHPASASWRSMSPSPLPGGYAAGVWTGEEVLLWSVGPDAGQNGPGGWRGAAWDPTTDTWRRLARAPRTEVYGYPDPIWVEDEVIDLNLGHTYDPDTDEWRPFPERPVRGPVESRVWTGQELIALVANRSDPSLPAGDAIAFAYDPADRRWRRLPPTGVREGTVAAWNGREVVVSNWDETTRTYDPEAERWRSLPLLPVPPSKCRPTPLALEDLVALAHCDGVLLLTDDGRWAVSSPPIESPGFAVPAGDTQILSWWSSDEHFNFREAPVTWFQAYRLPDVDEDLALDDRFRVGTVQLDLPPDVRLVDIEVTDLSAMLLTPVPSNLGWGTESSLRFVLETPGRRCTAVAVVGDPDSTVGLRRTAQQAGVEVETVSLPRPDGGTDRARVAHLPPGAVDGSAHVVLRDSVTSLLDLACPDLATADDLLAAIHR